MTAQATASSEGRSVKGLASRWLPRATVLFLMLLFVAWFSAYSIRRHDALLTHKADLGQIDQAVWNTAQGRLLQEIKGQSISTRLTDHFEPVFLPVSLIFYLWDDVRALIILQAVFLAAGAWPLHLFARRRLASVLPMPDDPNPLGPSTTARGGSGVSALAEWGAVAFVAAYLLAPTLQAAAVSEFHALPLAAPFIAASLWAVEYRRWGWFVMWAALVASTQEGAALLTMTLGLYAAGRSWWPALRRNPIDRRGALAGLGIAIFGGAWFVLATFVIIPRFAAEAYAIGQTPYAARFGTLGDSFSDILIALVTRPLEALRIAAEPLRVAYLAGLLLPVAGLALLAPEVLAVGLPLLLANLLSSYALQYSGELHYSAALAPVFTAAGAVGAARLLRWAGFRPGSARRPRWLPAVLFAVIIVSALGYQWAEGFTPLGKEYRAGWPAGWPKVTEHERLLARFAAQIPRDAALSTTPPLHPHLSHREKIYLFPAVGDADYVLVDVSGTTDRHPAEVKGAIDALLATGEFGVLDAADGYLLLQRGAREREIPASFYDFTRPQESPEHTLNIRFGDSLVLTGYTVEDNPKWRLTRFRFFWRVTGSLPPGTTIDYQALAPTGAVVDDSATRPLPVLLWQPPDGWKPGSDHVTETLAWYLPRTFAPVLSVDAGGQRIWPAVTADSDDVEVSPEGRLRLPAFERKNGMLAELAQPEEALQPSEVHFGAAGWDVRLAGWEAPRAAAPGSKAPLVLQWTAPGPAARDYSVFVHLRDAAGTTVARGDAAPTWFTPRPTSRLPANADLLAAYSLEIPPDLAPGRYNLIIGWYDWQTGERLPRLDQAGNPIDNEYVLGSMTVDRQAEPARDACCLTVSECCASQE